MTKKTEKGKIYERQKQKYNKSVYNKFWPLGYEEHFCFNTK